jgi:hypothetical protein
MCSAINNHANCEIHVVIRFFHTTNIVNYSQAVYCQNVMSEGTVRQWYRVFKIGRNNVQGEERSRRSPVLNDILFNAKDGASQFQNFHVNFHKFQAFFYVKLKLKENSI